MMDVKTLSGANELYHEGPHARQRRRGAPVAERARRVNGEYIAKARTLDHEHSRQADGTRYPGVREQVQGHLVGPVLAALRAWDPVLGLVVGSYQGCREALHGLAREAAKAKATAKWRQMGVRSVHEALGIYTHDVHRRWGSVSWLAVVGARHPRPPARHWAAERRHPSPRPAARVRARARGCWRGRGVAAGAPRRRARGTRGGRPVSERRAAAVRPSVRGCVGGLAGTG